MKCFSVLTVFIWITVSIKADSWDYGSPFSFKAGDWHYGNTSEWGGLCKTGTEQSPIDLLSDIAEEKVYSSFVFSDYDEIFPATIRNNGHSVAITLKAPKIPTLSGGGLIGDYVLDHFHFHWESEHTINGIQYPLEMHLVHYCNKYNNLSHAAQYHKGVAVLGVLFELSLDDDDEFVPLIEVMDVVSEHPDAQAALARNISARSFLPRNTGNYFRYTGSLTTPGCNEGVIWTVFTKPLPLSADQVEHFKAIWTHDGPLTLNYREVQPLNGRRVVIRGNKPGLSESPSSPSTGAFASISATVVSMSIFMHLLFIKNQ